MNDIRKLTFIGGGNMATALISGLKAKGLPASRMVVSDPNAEALARLSADYGVKHAQGPEAVQDAEVVVLAVKPQMMREALAALAPALKSARPLIISIAAGIPHAALMRWLGADAKVVRSMPNRPALNGCGAAGLFAPPGLGTEQRALAQSIMGAVGVAVWVEAESQLDTVTALSGSGPAYFFLFMEALEAAARARGLPAEIAHLLTLETAYGAAFMARNAADSLKTLRDQVTSKGGTTAAALAVMEGAHLRDIVAEALNAAERRSAELGTEFAAP
jgi:pyrroline-5-carboxylate reductase